MAVAAQRPRIGLILTIAALEVIVFAIDVITGHEISLSVFYLVPISIATWFFSRTGGLALSLLSAALWFAGDQLSGRIYSNDVIPLWNMIVRLGFFVIVTQTLSSRRRTERALIEAREEAMSANRAKTDFVNRVTHEFRTPLTAILGFTEILGKHAAPYMTPDDQSCLRRIRANAETLLHMVDGVLEVGRVEAGKAQPRFEAVDLAAIVTLLDADMRGRPNTERVELIVDAPAELRRIETDPYLLRQVLLNLVANAIKFTDDGYVKVSIEKDDEARPVSVTVEDTGIGIPAERMKAIFEPFEQADGSIHRTFGGAGLGLTIAKDLCDLLGYQLQVESTPGVGSRFTVVMASSS